MSDLDLSLLGSDSGWSADNSTVIGSGETTYITEQRLESAELARILR